MKSLLFTTIALISSLQFGTIKAFYDDNDKVVVLNKGNFKDLVLDKPDAMWFIEFYAPWCGHCKKLTPAWKEAAEKTYGEVSFGAVDMTTDREVGASYGIKGFPTLKFFGGDKKKPLAYSGKRDVKTLIQYAKDTAKEQQQKLAGGDFQKTESVAEEIPTKNPALEDAPAEPTPEQQAPKRSMPSELRQLNEIQFNEDVLSGANSWILLIFKEVNKDSLKLAQTFKREQSRIKDKVKLAIIDVEQNPNIATRLGITEFPAVRYFMKSKDSKPLTEQNAQVAKTNGLTTLMQLVQRLSQSSEGLLERLTDQKQFNVKCKPRVVCVIFFMPADQSQDVQSQQLDTLRETVSKVDDVNLVYLWAIKDEQKDLETLLEIKPSENVQAAALKAFQRKRDLLEGSALQADSLTDFLTRVAKEDHKYKDAMKRPKVRDINNKSAAAEPEEVPAGEEKVTKQEEL
eukprot:403344742